MSTATQTYTKDNPFVTELLENYKLNNEGSSKDTRHFSISLKGSDIEYKPGDSLYVYPENETGLVNELLALLKLDNDKEEEFRRFTQDVNITRASNKLYKLIETKLNAAIDVATMNERFNGYSVTALIKELKNEHSGLILGTNEVAENSSKLQARAYSIASSLRAHPQEVQLCIARVDTEINGQRILGVCSNYLSNRVPLNAKTLKIYLHINDKFRLPENPETNIIMVGPGTGIAPFRAFIEERNWQRDQGMKVGKDWLFFGDQRQAYDYIYGDELEAYKNKYGTEITTAFSRDQEQKFYVQDRMKEHANEIFKWLEDGAYFYVCGDARRMAKDVDTTLQQIIAMHGQNAETYIKDLKDSQRYCRDVY